MAFIKKHGPSFVGHILEGQLLALLWCVVAVWLLGWGWWQAYTICGFVVPWLFFYGREKRDCENALGIKGWRLSAYYLLWTRPSNITDLIGNPLFYAVVMALHHCDLV